MLANTRDLLVIVVLSFCAGILYAICTKGGLFVEVDDKVYHLSIGDKPPILRAKDSQ